MRLASSAKPGSARAERCMFGAHSVYYAAERTARGARHVAAAEKKQKLMWEALREAVDEEMEADPTVCLMGALLPGKAASSNVGAYTWAQAFSHMAQEPALF